MKVKALFLFVLLSGILVLTAVGCSFFYPPSVYGHFVATPTFSPTGGTYSNNQSINISCTTSGATIYYTMDGTTPTTSSTLFTTNLYVFSSNTTTIKAIAVKSNMANSKVTNATYTIIPAIPVVLIISPTDGSITNMTSFKVSGTANVDKPYSVTKVQLRTNGSAYFDAIGTTNWNASVTLTEGTNTIQARTIADSGKTNTSTTIDVIISKSLPMFAITDLADGSITNITSFTVSGTASVESPYSITKVQLRTNGSAYFDATGTTNWSAGVTLPEGTNTIQARTIADSGKTNISTTIDVIIDAAPTMSIACTLTNGGDLFLVGSANDFYGISSTWWTRPSGTVSVNFGNSNALETTVTPQVGQYTVRLNAEDNNGNLGFTNLNVVWTNTILSGTPVATNGFVGYSTPNGLVTNENAGNLNRYAITNLLYSPDSANAQIAALTNQIGWRRTYGGVNSDIARSIVQTSDGGFAVAGRTYTYGAGTPNYQNFYVLKLDSSGTTIWSKNYGGTSYDEANSIVQTSNGGFAVAGYTYSDGAGGADFWVLKLNSTNGSTMWAKTYGGTSNDIANSIIQTSDDGFAVAGYTKSYGNGGADFWVLKLDSSGNTIWSNTYGGTNNDYAQSIVQTSDGGFAVAGTTYSYGTGTPTFPNFYVLKLDTNGNSVWSNTYGGANDDRANSIVQTSDGDFAVAGSTYGAGGYNFYVLKLDTNGNTMWSNTYGGTSDDYAQSIVQTSDGDFAVAGYSYGAGNYDFWVLKLNSTNGNTMWSNTYGGANDDEANSIVQTSDGGFAIAGYTKSYGAGNDDFWVLKLDANGN